MVLQLFAQRKILLSVGICTQNTYCWWNARYFSKFFPKNLLSTQFMCSKLHTLTLISIFFVFQSMGWNIFQNLATFFFFKLKIKIVGEIINCRCFICYKNGALAIAQCEMFLTANFLAQNPHCGWQTKILQHLSPKI